MEGHIQCSRLVGRGEWRGIDSAHGYLKGCEWRGIDSAHS